MILVTGATGHIGGRVAELLVQHGIAPRRLARDPGRAPDLAGSPVVAGDYSDRRALADAMADIDTVFLASAGGPPLKRAALHGNVIDAAAEAGVRRVIYLSFQGASATSPFPYSADHLLSEAHLKQSGLTYSILRDSFYLDLIPDLADEHGVVRNPGGEGLTAWVAREDVAQSVVAVLLGNGHDQRTYDLTGPEAITLKDACHRLAASAGGWPRYEPETLEQGRAWRAATGAAEWEVEAWIGSYLAMGSGELAAVSDHVQTLLGRRPMSLEEYLPRLLSVKRHQAGR